MVPSQACAGVHPHLDGGERNESVGRNSGCEDSSGREQRKPGMALLWGLWLYRQMVERSFKQQWRMAAGRVSLEAERPLLLHQTNPGWKGKALSHSTGQGEVTAGL